MNAPIRREAARRFLRALAAQFPALTDELATGRGSHPTAGRACDSADHRPDPAVAAAQAQEDRAAAHWNASRGLAGLADTAPPVRLYISDTIRDITDGVIELEEAICDRLALPRPGRAGLVARLRRIDALLDRIAGDPVLERHVHDEARRMARRCAHALGDEGPLVRIPNAICPYCDSVSLRSLPLRGEVWCVNPVCRCGDPACRCATGEAAPHTWPDDTPPPGVSRTSVTAEAVER